NRRREQAHQRHPDTAPHRLHRRFHRERKIDARRCHLWDHISERLDQLGNQITAADRKQIEAAIAAKLPRPTPAEYKDIARNNAQLIGWEWITTKQKAALHDEAEQWQDHTGDLAKRMN